MKIRHIFCWLMGAWIAGSLFMILVATQNFRYEEEDQTPGLRPGARVNHAQFGPGTVVSVEDLEDDQKLVVKFASVGTKTLRARYAKLQRA